MGPSRKSFIGALLDRVPPAERLEGTLAACVMAVAAGAHIVRVHDVAVTRDALAVATATLAHPWTPTATTTTTTTT